jgi:hypothetical protein
VYRPREQRVQVIGHPVGVDTAGRGGQHVGASGHGRGISGIGDRIAEADSDLVHTDRLTEQLSGGRSRPGPGRSLSSHRRLGLGSGVRVNGSVVDNLDNRDDNYSLNYGNYSPKSPLSCLVTAPARSWQCGGHGFGSR